MTSAASRLSRVSAAAIAFAVALSTSPAFAAGYLKLGDIKGQAQAASGEGKKDFYKGWIELNGWSWGETRSGGKMHMEDLHAAPSAGDGDPDRPLVSGRLPNAKVEKSSPSISEIVVTKDTDASTPKLMESAVKGKVFASPAPRGSLTTMVPAGTCKVGARYPTAELGDGGRVYKMQDVVITACEAASGSDRPMETLSLNYTKVVWR